MHIKNHPIFGTRRQEPVTIFFNGKPLEAYKSQTVAAALMANGIKKLGESRKLMQPRGLFCSRGRCCSCYMTVNGEEHVRTCMKEVEDGMNVQMNMGDPDVRRECNGD